MFVEQVADLFFLFMDAGQYNMAGWFFCQLYNAFAQVSINHFNPIVLQVLVQVALFGKHGLTFDEAVNPMPFQYGMYNEVVFFGIGGPMYFYSVFLCIFFKFEQVIVQVGKHIVFDQRSCFP
ncbi:hypothetical protein D3C86_1785030 [compost metagenome]